MADYIITRTSQDELMHHGVKGQKWGIRRYQNADGTLTNEGKIRYGSEKEQSKLSEGVKKFSLNSNSGYSRHDVKKRDKARDRVENSPQVKAAIANAKDSASKAVAAWNEAQKMENDWYSGKNKAYDEYVHKAAVIQSKRYGDGTKEDIDQRLWLMKNDDLDQGESFNLWLNDNPKARKQYGDAYERYDRVYKEHLATCKKYASEWLGSHANDEVSRSYLSGKADQPIIRTTADALGSLIAHESYRKAEK